MNKCYICSKEIDHPKTSAPLVCSIICLLKTCSFERKDKCWDMFKSLRYHNHSYQYQRAQKLAYELLFGIISKDMTVITTCNNKKCLNPDHLKAIKTIDRKRNLLKKSLKNYHKKTKEPNWKAI